MKNSIATVLQFVSALNSNRNGLHNGLVKFLSRRVVHVPTTVLFDHAIM